MTVQVDEPESPGRARRPRVAVRAGVVVAGLAVLAVLVWAFGPDGQPGTSTQRTGGAAGGGHGSAGADDGLAQGGASAAFDSATRRVSGVPRGFPHTVDGAVEAYVSSLGTFVMGMATMSDAELDTFTGDFMQTDLDYSSLARDKRAMLGLQADGTPRGSDGTKVYASCPASLGAYKTKRENADAVSVSYWGPCIYGTGSPQDRSGLHVVWQWSTATMRWVDGDWRLPATRKPAPPKAPAPADLNRPDTRFTERADLLGPGWALFEGASQGWPTALLGEEP